MNIDLTTKEIRKILVEKFGEGSFRVVYTESDEDYEDRTGKEISKLKEAPVLNSYLLKF